MKKPLATALACLLLGFACPAAAREGASSKEAAAAPPSAAPKTQAQPITLSTCLEIPGTLQDTMPGGVLLRTVTGQSILLPDGVAMTLTDREHFPDYAPGAPVRAIVPVDAAELTVAGSDLITISTSVGPVQLPISLLPEQLLDGTSIYVREVGGGLIRSSLREALQQSGFGDPELPVKPWNSAQAGPAVVVAKRPNGNLLCVGLHDGGTSLRELEIEPGSRTTWPPGQAMVILPDAKAAGYRIRPWREGDFGGKAMLPPSEPEEEKIAKRAPRSPSGVRKLARGSHGLYPVSSWKPRPRMKEEAAPESPGELVYGAWPEEAGSGRGAAARPRRIALPATAPAIESSASGLNPNGALQFQATQYTSDLALKVAYATEAPNRGADLKVVEQPRHGSDPKSSIPDFKRIDLKAIKPDYEDVSLTDFTDDP